MDGQPLVINEIKQYRGGRCITAIVAIYRLYGFPLYDMSPFVLQMQVHLPGRHMVAYKARDDLNNVVRNPNSQRSMLTEHFSTRKSAISRAIEYSSQRKGGPIFFPYEGTTFNSYEEAKEFYNLYSWEVGFGIRISRSKTNKNDYNLTIDLNKKHVRYELKNCRRWQL
jgi:hypothetical protein